ncbi:hypothetical protein Syun_022619 [Stephania yunnanensis]|uniref:Uncharacterized protein n=1 Tax=Stephania yunnanensis TaxID=152371 RepID=A0AAP0FDM2_9MAGN
MNDHLDFQVYINLYMDHNATNLMHFMQFHAIPFELALYLSPKGRQIASS